MNQPLEEIGIFSLSDESSPHHDGLEALAFDGPQSAIGSSLDGGRPFAVVQYGQFAKHLPRCHCAEVFVFAGNLHATLCEK